jgi:hypothetical protein
MDGGYPRRHSWSEDGQVPARPLQPGTQASAGQRCWPGRELSQLRLCDGAVIVYGMVPTVSCDRVPPVLLWVVASR